MDLLLHGKKFENHITVSIQYQHWTSIHYQYRAVLMPTRD